MTLVSVLLAAKRYLSTIDTAGRTADDDVKESGKGEPIKKGSAALLICGPEWRKRHFRKVRIDFLKQRWREPTLPKVKQGCY